MRCAQFLPCFHALQERDEDSSEDSDEAVGAASSSERSIDVRPQLVQYTDRSKGDGEGCVKLRSNVVVQYSGFLASNGYCFDRSKAGAPLRFTIGSDAVVEGFEDGLLGMKLGGERIIHVPPEAGYGHEGLAARKIPPNATLRFEVRLLGLEQLF